MLSDRACSIGSMVSIDEFLSALFHGDK
jgi:hypothetical protein